jgi:hypothetical protein
LSPILSPAFPKTDSPTTTQFTTPYITTTKRLTNHINMMLNYNTMFCDIAPQPV